MPTIGMASARRDAARAQADLMEQQRIAAWYQAHPDRAIHILGDEGAAAIGIESDRYRQQKAQQEAAAIAEQWKTEYTTKQKHRIATIQNGLEQMRASGKFDAVEMESAERAALVEMAGISETWSPKDDGQKQMEAWAKEGKGVGMEWVDEWGNVKTREADGTIKGQVAYDKTREGQEAARVAARDIAREKHISESRLKLQGETVKDPATDQESARYRPVQIEAMLEQAYPWYREQNIQTEMQERQALMQHRAAQQEIAQQQQVEQQSNDYILEEARKRGVKLIDKDMDLPAPIAIAQARLREWKDRYGGYDGLPSELRAAWREGKRILEQYASEMSQQVQRGQPVQQAGVGQTIEPELPAAMGRNVTPLNPSGHIFR